ncbi:centrosome-associated protein 350-like isoform X2 [Pecten maximus]|nr:centrosome-associated protein 350-like isoform X2 [Pecten maximus]
MHAAELADERDADFKMQDFEANKEHASSTAAELERARVLSEEARRVLSDLNYGSDEDDMTGKHGDDARHRSRKSAIKRKAPKSTETEKQQPIAKQRHYDAKEVRRYIQQQKRARLRQQREDEQKQKEADKVKRKQLEELYNKQKQSAVTSASHTKKGKDVPERRDGRQSRHRGDETFIHPASLADLPRHHPFHENRQRMVVSSESEKENRGICHSDEEMSDDSSTITGDSMEEETTETATPRVEAEKTKVKFTGKTNDKDSETVPNNFPVDGENNIRNVGGFTFNVEGVMNKFSQALHSKGEQLSSNSGVGGSVPSVNGGLHAAPDGAVELPRTRADRIQAIKATAATLQSRIQAEARKITGHDVEGGASAANPNPNSRWALPRAGGSEDNDAFVSRYEKMIGADTNYSVFASNLPGAKQASPGEPDGLDDSSIEPEAAAIRIQAAYRGHTVRQSLTWKLPSGRTMLASHRDGQDDEEESSISETSTFSDITITEDSENSLSSPPRKIGAGLRDKDFHAAAKRSRPSQEMNIPRPQGHTTKYSWEDPTSDPYSVLNVFARQKRNQVKQRQGPVGEESRVTKSRATIPVKEDEVKREKTTSQQTAPKPTPRQGVTDSRSRSPGVGYRPEGSHPVGTGLRTSNFASITETLKNKSETTQPKTASVSFKIGTEKSDDDTLEEDSYMKTADSGDDKKSKPYKYEKRPTKPQPRSSSIKPVRKEGSGSDMGRKEDSESDVSLETDRPSYSLHRPSYATDETNLKFPARYSPNTLERQFNTELNQLESMEESMRQLTNMERTRAVSMAQQETVSLAQMLKARQHEHSKEMSMLELKAQREMLDATKELNTVRQRSMEVTQTAAEAITRLRAVPTDTKQKTGRKVTADPRSRSEVTSILETDNIRPRKNRMTSSAKESDRVVPDSARTATSYTVDSRTGRSREVLTSDSVRTASDTHKNRDSDSSIRSISGAEAHDESRSESIVEDISQASGDEYSVMFDDTMTEDEMEEKSFKAILPSESHRKRAKKHSGDNMSVTSDEGSVASVPTTPRMSLDDLSSFFTGEESFNKFTEEMVRQFMREEELRAQHQGALLRLREKALTEKTKAELAWLDQQRQNLRNKGADDNYPQIIKRQRGLKMRLQEQQAEIKRLQESNKAASLERQRLLKQHTEISRMRKNTIKTKERLKGSGRLGRPSEVHTEDEVSNFDEHKEGGSGRKKKDYKSDSEIYTEPKVSHKKSVTDDSSALGKLKKIHFDERFLTAREQKLLDRRKKAEELLRWKQRLDHEESRVFKMEQKAIKIWETPDNRRPDKTPAKEDRRSAKTPAKTVQDDKAEKVRQRNEPKESQTASTMQESTIASASVLTAKDDSVRRSVTDTPRTEIASGSESSPEERLRERDNKAFNSGSESSIVEELASNSSVDDGSPATPRVHKSRLSGADDTIINDSQYNNDSFEETSVQGTSSKRSGKSPRSPLDRLSQGLSWLSGRTVRSNGNRSPFSRYRSSESESEESISHTESYTETQSDFSDYEGRVRALNEELKRRKVEADRLKKERKKRKKEILKNKEVALKKQIEAYDNQIVQLKAELQKEMEHEPVKSSVRPQIKQPKVSPPKSRPRQEVTTPSKKGNNSSISEDSKEGTDSAQSSPSITEDTKLSSPTPKTAPSTPLTKAGSLEKISEASESTISRSRSDNTTQRSLAKPFRNDDTSIRTEISEDIDENIEVADDSVSERSKSALLHITKELPSHTAPRSAASVSRQDDDVSYTEDFTADDGVSARLPQSARSDISDHTEHKQRTFTDNISEQISEMMSVRSEDSQFIQSLDLQGRQEQPDDGYIDQKSPRSSYSTTTASRPSSGRSQSSQNLNGSFDDSDVEPSQASSVPVGRGDLPSRSGDGFYDGGEIDDEEETPTASPRDGPTTEMDIMGDFNIGDRVLVTGPRGVRSPGTLLFKGKVSFAPGIWAGVELEAADGRNDGSHEGVRYFTCHPGHGVLVPGDDLMPAPAIRSPRRSVASSHDDESITTDDQDESDLIKIISEVDNSVSNFSEGFPSPRSSTDRLHQKEALTDTITDQILMDVVRDDMNTINRIQDRKASPPAVAQKPSKRPDKDGASTLHMNGNVDSDGERDINQNDKRSQMTEKLTKNLLNDAINDMITIRNKQRDRQEPPRSGNRDQFSSGEEPQTFSPTEVEHMWGRGSPADNQENPPRPVSPIPGSTSRATKEGNKELDQDLNYLLFDDKADEYIDDDPIIPSPTMNQPPPPYPGLQPELILETGNLDFHQIQEDVFFSVPHERHEIEEVVSSAVDVFWNQRRYGESLEGLEPPETYFSTEDNNNDVDSKSRRVFEKLLFDSTGDIIRDIYREEDQDGTCAWKQTKRTRQKYFRGANPPTTIDVLKPIVQKAVIEILGLNGSRKVDKNRWSVRKKKDHVDNILVEELREEEPDWVNYDDDETAVKMQLTEAIFETLLTDTVQTMNKIYRKKQMLSQQQQ